MNSNSHIWWKQVSGPSMLINKITDILLEEKSVALFFNENIPWYDVFSTMIKDRLHRKNFYNEIEIINISDVNVNDANETGKFIAEKYCSNDVLSDYWPGESYAYFLANNDDLSLNNKYIWIKGLTPENFNAWYEFVYDYVQSSEKGKKTAIFFLECPFSCPVGKTKKISLINLDETIHKYDYYMFCSILVSDLKCSDEMKHYISDLAYNLSECKAEFAADLLSSGISLAENPSKALKKCVSKFVSSDGKKIYLENTYNTDSLILEVQIKNIFPAIERYRRLFITKYHSDICQTLPVQNVVIDEEIKKPYECEINILRWMTDKKKIRPSNEDIIRVRLMHDARNLIAHNKMLTYDNISDILD